jgi:hypothetical protein
MSVKRCGDPRCNLKSPSGSSYFDSINCVGRCPRNCRGRSDFGQCVQDCSCECMDSTNALQFQSPFFDEARETGSKDCPFVCDSMCSNVSDPWDCRKPCMATCPVPKRR